MNQRSANECLFCESRMCYDRVYSQEASYDEVACQEHKKELWTHADKLLAGKIRTTWSSTGCLRREKGSIINESSGELVINLNVECPFCEHEFDALEYDEDYDLIGSLFDKHFSQASGFILNCPECSLDFVLGEIER